VGKIPRYECSKTSIYLIYVLNTVGTIAILWENSINDVKWDAYTYFCQLFSNVIYFLASRFKISMYLMANETLISDLNCLFVAKQERYVLPF
jgi:hypothetical protein